MLARVLVYSVYLLGRMIRVGHNTGWKNPIVSGMPGHCCSPLQARKSVCQWFQFPQRPLGRCPLGLVKTGGKAKLRDHLIDKLDFFPFPIPLISKVQTLPQSYCPTIKWFLISNSIFLCLFSFPAFSNTMALPISLKTTTKNVWSQ